MKNLILAAVASLGLASTALADDGSDTFKGFGFGGAIAGSAITNVPQGGNWSAGAMTQSYGGVAFRETETGVKLDTVGGSSSETFGKGFRGRLSTGGLGGGFGAKRFKGVF